MSGQTLGWRSRVRPAARRILGLPVVRAIAGPVLLVVRRVRHAVFSRVLRLARMIRRRWRRSMRLRVMATTMLLGWEDGRSVALLVPQPLAGAGAGVR